MNDDDRDAVEIDRLVRELSAPRRVPLTSKPPFAGLVASQQSQQTELRPGKRWTNVRLLMPSRLAPNPERRPAFASAISLPHLGDLNLGELSSVFRMPGPVTMARMWAGLGAVYSAAMTFWPYPKTYLLGLELYLLSVGLALVAGIWGARLSWEARLGGAHTVSLGAVAWAVALAASQTLPLL